MRAAGVEIAKFRPLRWYSLDRVNHRTHRKLLIVDGRVGYTGGIGLADLFAGNAQDEDHWRDSQFRAEGPVVGQMQAAFMDNWIQTGGALLDGPAYFPPLDSVGPQRAQAVHSSPGDETENLRLMYTLARRLRPAEHPDRERVLRAEHPGGGHAGGGAPAGVEVEIIVPGKIGDAAVVRRASRAKWGPLLEAGVKIYEYQPTMYHNKVMIVDDYWVTVGSTNLDNRSFRLNDEANLNLFDEELARSQAAVLAEDRSRSREVTLEDWKAAAVPRAAGGADGEGDATPALAARSARGQDDVGKEPRRHVHLPLVDVHPHHRDGPALPHQLRPRDHLAPIRSRPGEKVQLELDGGHPLRRGERRMDGVDRRRVRQRRDDPAVDDAILLRVVGPGVERDAGAPLVVTPEDEPEEAVHRDGGERVAREGHGRPLCSVSSRNRSRAAPLILPAPASRQPVTALESPKSRHARPRTTRPLA
jgi:hypothetical protein